MYEQIPSLSFSGRVPEFYDKYLDSLFFEHCALEMADAIGEILPSTVLELAAGTGQLTKLLPAVVTPNGLIIASDINPAMMEYGKRNSGDERISWREIDAVTIPFDENSFEVVAAQFGVMFYSDRQKAFRESLRVLKPGGTFIFSCWDEMKFNPAASITNEVLHDLFPENTPGFYSVAFSYFNKDRIREDIKQAGFKDVDIEIFRSYGFSMSAAHAAKGLVLGTPTAAAVNERDATKLEPLLEKIEQRIIAAFGDDTITLPIQALIVSCTK